MYTDIKRILKKNRLISWILVGGLLVQLVTSITAIGVSSADQHFQVVEFSMYQLNKPNGATQVWEIDNFVRPTLQVYLFSAYHIVCNSLGITDPYAQLTIVRIILGLIMFAVFNLMAFYYLRQQPQKILIWVLLLVNFSWALPYTRTLFSSEMMCSLFFFGTLLLYDYHKDRTPNFLFLLLIGFMFCLSFYFRFQIAFALAGIAIWIVFFEKRRKHVLPLLTGFVAGMLVNSWLDYDFYNEFVFTPYTYFHANIIAGRAAGFGTSSFLRYIGLILLVAPAPLFSFVLFYFMLKTSARNFAHPIVLSVVLFTIFHCLIGHKEERFMFPIFNALPIIIGLGLTQIDKIIASSKRWVPRTLSVLLWLTIFLNTALLIIMSTVPFSQTILFSRLVKDKFHNKQQLLFCIGQTPFETPSGNQMEFYKSASRNISTKKIRSFNEAVIYTSNPKYISASYNAVKNNFQKMSELGYRPVLCSSRLLWTVNTFLQSRNLPTINEIWMLYEKKDDVHLSGLLLINRYKHGIQKVR